MNGKLKEILSIIDKFTDIEKQDNESWTYFMDKGYIEEFKRAIEKAFNNSYDDYITVDGKYNIAKVFTKNVDDKTIEQIRELCNQEWVRDSDIRIMPDCHAGKGCVIGTTMNIVDKVCPNIVGVDIGCGMLTVKLSPNIKEIDLDALDEFINNNVPSGFNVYDDEHCLFSEKAIKLDSMHCYDRLHNLKHIKNSFGTLGGGNHFIEIDRSNKTGDLYLVIHTGSRNLGKQVAELYQEMAYKECNVLEEQMRSVRKSTIEFYKRVGQPEKIEHKLKELEKDWKARIYIPKDLSYLTGENMQHYLYDMRICQDFAHLNRVRIAMTILEYLYSKQLRTRQYIEYNEKTGMFHIRGDIYYECGNDSFETVHNYIDNSKILRKGAISSLLGKRVLIPINMRDGCIMAMGKSNADWNFSAPHGAGRIMSRMQAKENVTLEEFKESMEGIYSTSITESTIDESPMVYKSMEDIMENIKDTVVVLDILKPIYSFKAH